MKTCKKCGAVRDDNIKVCRICRSEYNKNWRINNPNYMSGWYLENRDLFLERQREYYHKNKCKHKQTRLKWLEKNRDHKNQKNKEWYFKNADRYKKRYSDNRDFLINYRKELINLLTDGYIKSLLASEFGILNPTPELIEGKRQEIKFKRLIKTIKHGNKNSSKPENDLSFICGSLRKVDEQ